MRTKLNIMKKIKVIIALCFAVVVSACEVDNYPGPNAGLSGKFIDSDTEELIQQDINSGSVVEIREHGYDPVTPQYLRVKNDGTYSNTLLFANTYTIQPVRGNFIAVAPQDLEIKGQTTLDFRVIPYIRIKDASIVKNGTKIIATFRVEQNVTNNVRKIGLYAHADPHVGEPLRLVAAENNINSVTDPNQVYTLEIDLPSNSTQLVPGRDYFFRVGALIDVSEAKLNYASAARIGI